MSDFEQISIPPTDGAFTNGDVTSSEDAPPTPLSESTTRADAVHAETVANSKSYRELRERFAEKAYKVAKYGLYWWATVLLLSAVGKVCKVEIFSDNVLIAVTSASTLNLFAAFLGVIRGLFPHKYQENGFDGKTDR
ncbi:hypothetical protein QUF31_00605 [Dickeya chrysanthemi]|uniref:hypothetical protein n=1 Tax=Dickeya chrysanthemi TaxID=556 RepID=UPI0025A11947|nr:hypothetical protein [Dickeya chrysanthemi]WJM85670.1 hypothetical protein QUF31_00605 [Dickeya chrysanthemi]